MVQSRVLALLAGAGLVLVACGTGGGSTTNKGTIRIGVDLPESGNEASNGLPTLNGVKYAVQKVGSIKGFTLEVSNKDDAVNGQHNPAKGVQNIKDLIADSKVLGVVGPFNSNVMRAEEPVANPASLVLISPANTNPCLTKDIYMPKRLGVSHDITCTEAGLATPESLRPNGKNNYFRVATTDDFQGPSMADYATDTLKLTKVAVGSDHEVYGQGIADTFAQEFKNKGGSVVLREDFDSATTNDFRPFITRAKNAGAQGIYFGGTDSNKACIVRAQMKGLLDGKFMGGDGIVTAQCLTDAAANAADMLGTVATADATKIASSKSIVDDFKKAFPNKDDFGAYTMPGYDAATILIEAIGRAIDDAGGNMPTREQVRVQVTKTKDYTGALGVINFDQNGDTTNYANTLYHAEGTPIDWVSIGVVQPKV